MERKLNALWLRIRLSFVALSCGAGVLTTAANSNIGAPPDQLIDFSEKTIWHFVRGGGLLAGVVAILWIVMLTISLLITLSGGKWQQPNWRASPFDGPMQAPHLLGFACVANGLGFSAHILFTSDQHFNAWGVVDLMISMGIGSIAAAYLATFLFRFKMKPVIEKVAPTH
jgi:hypothetical protein